MYKSSTWIVSSAVAAGSIFPASLLIVMCKFQLVVCLILLMTFLKVAKLIRMFSGHKGPDQFRILEDSILAQILSRKYIRIYGIIFGP